MSDSGESVHNREPLRVEGGMDSLEEWASEGESKTVDETERILRYQIGHMSVCDERIRAVSSRVAPQENKFPVPAWIGTGFFMRKKIRKHIPIPIEIPYQQ